MNSKTNRSNPIFIAAAILLCIVMVTTHFTSGLYARYVCRSSADSSARVASFSIETDLDRITLGTSTSPMLQLGGTDETQSVSLPFYISSGSEVSVGYSVIVNFGSALPEYVSIMLSNGTRTETIAANGSMSEFVFNEFGALSVADEEAQIANLVLTIAISDLSMITDEISIPTAELTVRVYQID